MIYIGADHRGFKLKTYLKRYLKNQLKLKYEDVGALKYDPTDDAPDFALKLSRKVSKKPTVDKGILICWTGHAMCITANKIKKIRAVEGYNIESAEFGRLHNNANVLCLASKFLSEDHAVAIVKKFLETNFDGDSRLVRRDKKITKLEK